MGEITLQTWSSNRPDLIYREVSPPDQFFEVRNPFPPVVEHKLLDALKDPEGTTPIPRHPFCASFIEVLKGSDFFAVDERRGVAPERLSGMHLRGEPCPECKDRMFYTRTFQDRVSGLVIRQREKCLCNFHRLWWTVWGNTAFVPVTFRHARFGHLRPNAASKASIADQQKVIDLLNEHPADSYFFCGHAGVGKTHLSLALFENAIRAWAIDNFYNLPCATAHHTMFRVSTKTWVDEALAYRFRKGKGKDEVPMPRLNVSVIRNLAKVPGRHICVIFDEIDKVGINEFRLAELFEIVNLLSEVGAQIIATSNSTPDELMQQWGEKMVHVSEPTLRRFYDTTATPTRHLVELLREEPVPASSSSGSSSKSTGSESEPATPETSETPEKPTNPGTGNTGGYTQMLPNVSPRVVNPPT